MDNQNNQQNNQRREKPDPVVLERAKLHEAAYGKVIEWINQHVYNEAPDEKYNDYINSSRLHKTPFVVNND